MCVVCTGAGTGAGVRAVVSVGLTCQASHCLACTLEAHLSALPLSLVTWALSCMLHFTYDASHTLFLVLAGSTTLQVLDAGAGRLC